MIRGRVHIDRGIQRSIHRDIIKMEKIIETSIII